MSLWLPCVTVHADNPMLLQLKQMAGFPLALVRQECPTAPSAPGRGAWDSCYSQEERGQPPLLAVRGVLLLAPQHTAWLSGRMYYAACFRFNFPSW